MGHRALVARARATGGYDLFETRWGADGWADLTTRAGDVREPPGRPAGTADSLEAVVAEHVDYLSHEAVFVARARVRPHLVCWFGLPGRGGDPRDGALVSVDPLAPTADGEYLRGWFAGTKRLLLGLADAGTLVDRAARAWLVRRVASLADHRRVRFAPESG
ncbi:MAG: DUF6735 family protein [Halorientalis sp.]